MLAGSSDPASRPRSTRCLFYSRSLKPLRFLPAGVDLHEVPATTPRIVRPGSVPWQHSSGADRAPPWRRPQQEFPRLGRVIARCPTARHSSESYRSQLSCQHGSQAALCLFVPIVYVLIPGKVFRDNFHDDTPTARFYTH